VEQHIKLEAEERSVSSIQSELNIRTISFRHDEKLFAHSRIFNYLRRQSSRGFWHPRIRVLVARLRIGKARA